MTWLQCKQDHLRNCSSKGFWNQATLLHRDPILKRIATRMQCKKLFPNHKRATCQIASKQLGPALQNNTHLFKSATMSVQSGHYTFFHIRCKTDELVGVVLVRCPLPGSLLIPIWQVCVAISDTMLQLVREGARSWPSKIDCYGRAAALQPKELQSAM